MKAVHYQMHMVLLFGPFRQVTFVITSRLDKQTHLHIKTKISNGGQWPDGNLRFPWVNHNEMVCPYITTSKIKTTQVFFLVACPGWKYIWGVD